MSEPIEIPIETGASKKFESPGDFAKWLESEAAIWQWLWTSKGNVDTSLQVNDLAPLSNTFSQGRNVAAGGDHAQIRDWIMRAYHNRPGHLLASFSPAGMAVLNAKERIGPDEARVMYYCHWQGLNASHLRTPGDIRGALLAADPTSLDHLSVVKELQRERSNYRRELTMLANRILEIEQEKRDIEAHRLGKARQAVSLLRRGVKRRADAISAKISNEADSAVASILETEERYRRQMELAAPVEYWRTKSEDHATAEGKYAIWTAGYFVVAVVLFTVSAVIASKIILGIEDPADRAPIYVITAGALIGITTLLFWIGRLIVKLWLSEHHLRKDAAERAIMTQSFLAMTENDQSLESERAIVLSAIFRPSPDGVVKEEGPHDLGLQAALSKVLSR